MIDAVQPGRRTRGLADGDLDLDSMRPRPECVHIYSHSLQVSSSWIVDMQPYGADDNFVFALKDDPALFVFRSDTQRVIKLDGPDGCLTRKLACAAKRIAQIDTQRGLHVYLQDDIDDEVFVAGHAPVFQGVGAVDFCRDASHMVVACDGGLQAVDLPSCQVVQRWTEGEAVEGLVCSPHQQEYFLSTTKAQAQLYDQRAGPVASRNSGLCQAKWSPLVPYWLAACLADALCIFDLRYSLDQPVRCYKDHVGCFAWSNAHCDLLVGAGVDRSVSLYGLSRTRSALQSTPCLASGGPLTCCTRPNQ